ncbi:hypothetical protein [Salipiger sp. PrR002]|uniref:hypothetical protein n=1 Tax=Salipiger sp. PrR002 TaxID=2706489 RepID=UPI0013B7CED3|nr:hypothetical protein [Salipiger sp. PrR002]NDW01717.1 hypothetical protein [Salipiger sp. PrR002]NDW59197.1 hypothetical protein [Salipiger sp. PrR004]
MTDKTTQGESLESPGRRELLGKAGKYAAVTPLAVTALLSTSMKADAGGIFRSGGMKHKHKHKMKMKMKKHGGGYH